MSIKFLKRLANHPNIAVDLDEQLLTTIGLDVIDGYKKDVQSNSEWTENIKKIEDMAILKVVKKSTPLQNSANVRLPLITKAAYEYSSRTLPEIIKDDKVVKTKIIGKDKDNVIKKARAQRSAEYVNYQLLFKDDEWQKVLSKLIFRLSIIGFLCIKVVYDPVRREIKHILCKPDELVIHADSPSLYSAPRISHVLHYTINDLLEYANTEVNNIPLFLPEVVEKLKANNSEGDPSKPLKIIEQCTQLDLDEDGYTEPYIVTCSEDGKVLGIVAEYDEDCIYGSGDKISYIDKECPYIDYHYLENPDGSFQSVGFGILLLHLNDAANSIMNQLIDAGQLSNLKGGFMDARMKQIKTGNSLHTPGEFKLVQTMAGMKLSDGILPIQYGEPSSVLYQLLGLIMDVSRDLTASAQVNIGTQSSENAKTGATLALQEEGKKIFNAINKGVTRSLGQHFKRVFKLNYKYLSQDDYQKVLDDELADVQRDFDPEDFDIQPVADPSLSSSQSRIAEAAIIQSLMQLPGIDPSKATELILERIDIPGVEKLLATQNQAPPNPEMLKLQAEMEYKAQDLNIRGKELEISEKELLIKAAVAEGQILQFKANAAMLMEKAKLESSNTYLKDLGMQFDIISKKMDTDLAMNQMAQDNLHKQQDLQQQQQEAQSAGNQSETNSEAGSGVGNESSDSGTPPPDSGT